MRVGTPVSVPPVTMGGASQNVVATAACSFGERATGGGFDYVDGDRVDYSRPSPDGAGSVPTGWAARVDNNSAVSRTATAYVICQR